MSENIVCPFCERVYGWEYGFNRHDCEAQRAADAPDRRAERELFLRAFFGPGGVEERGPYVHRFRPVE